jgi:uncharacterized protein (TIGR02145 family)
MNIEGKNTNRSRISFPGAILAIMLLIFPTCSKDNPADSTIKVPVLTTTSVSAITQTTARSGGTIIWDGGASVTARGICWSTNANPTVANSTTSESAAISAFAGSMTGLNADTPYYVRAYATNSAGTGYGNTQSFTTLASIYMATDIDGNIYHTVTLGTQVWMADNLKVTHYRYGNAIPKATEGTTWASLTTGAFCEYNNDVGNAAAYGRLYNWYAVINSHSIAPAGWHMPSDAEWKQLEMYLGMSQAEADLIGWRGTDEGGKLKEGGYAHWNSPNTGATNESGFSGLPGGYRDYDGDYVHIGNVAYFWSATEDYTYHPLVRALFYCYSEVGRYSYYKQSGFSVRCVKD